MSEKVLEALRSVFHGVGVAVGKFLNFPIEEQLFFVSFPFALIAVYWLVAKTVRERNAPTYGPFAGYGPDDFGEGEHETTRN